MGNVDQRQNHIDNIEKISTEISERQKEDLIRRRELGTELSFKKGEELFDGVFDMVQLIETAPLNRLPIDDLNALGNQLKALNNQLDNISNFDASTQNPTNERNKLLNQLDDRYREILHLVSPVLSFRGDSDEEIEALRENLQKQLEEVQNRRNEIENILESARDASGKIGVSRHSTIFEKESGDNQKIARRWMFGSAIFGFLTIAVAALFTFFVTGPPTDSLTELIRVSGGKLVIISVFYYGLIWCSRNYFANKHNSVVNKHRQNALDTFETFVNATDDPEIKDAVLIEATESIFSFRSSGYNRNENEGSSPQIIEMIRSINGKSNP